MLTAAMKRLNLETDRNFFKTIFAIALPSAFQGLVSLLVVYLDDIMVSRISSMEGLGVPGIAQAAGNVGDIALAGVSQANAVTSLFTAATLGLASGSAVLISQFWGKKDMASIKRVFPIVTLLCLLVSLVFVAIALLIPDQVLGLVLSSDDITEATRLAARAYFQVVCFSYIPYAIAYALIGMLRSVEIVRVTLYITISALFTNLFFNYVFIYGRLGFPQLGIRGAAVATVITRVVELAFVWYYTFYRQKKLDIRPRDLLRFDRAINRRYMRYGLPVGLADLQWAIVGFGKAMIIGVLADEVLAANRAAEALMQLGFIFTNSLATGACIVVGKSVGENDYAKTRRYSNTIQVMFACIGIAVSLAVFAARDVYLSTYGLSPQAHEYAMSMAALGALTMIGTTYHASCFVGINRGAGDSRFTMTVDIICGWLIVLPLSYLAAVVWQLSPPLVFLFIRIDQCFKWIIAFIRLRGNKWIRNITLET